ncbi:Ran-specific GTPase-activating protein 30, partial [Coemansia guatemalensis]
MDANAAAGTADSMYVDFCYELRLVEDQNDGRYHDLEQDSTDSSSALHPAWVADVTRHLESRDVRPGRTVRIPMESIGGLHYTSSGSLLNIEDSNSPVLVISFEFSRNCEDGLGISASAGTPGPEAATTTRWYALEVANDAEPSERSDDSDSDSENNNNSDGHTDDVANDSNVSDDNCTELAKQPSSESASESSTPDDSESFSDDADGSEYKESDSVSSGSEAEEDEDEDKDEDKVKDKVESESESEDQAARSTQTTSGEGGSSEEIDELVESVASLCNISQDSSVHDNGSHTPPASGPQASQQQQQQQESAPPSRRPSDADLVPPENYFEPVEFLANEW